MIWRIGYVSLAILLAAAGWQPASPQETAGEVPPGRPPTGPLFAELASSGLDFVHFNGMTGKFYFPEMTGQGGALLDYDNDGDLDVFLVQGSLLGPDDTFEDALFPPTGTRPPSDRLFRNDLVASADSGRIEPRFVDVTEQAGIRAHGYGMGVAVGDFDNNGWLDLYITNYGPNQMLLATGDGTFTDVTERSGTGDKLWGTSAAALDFDGDGWQDIYVANYVVFDAAKNPRCFSPSSRLDYCGPADYPPQRDRLFHNLGDGTFQDVTDRVLIDYRPGPGLGVVAADFNADNRIDIYVNNDGDLNQLWVNLGDGRFRDDALLAGVAVNRDGRAEASMGISAGDFDRDGDEDLFLTHLMGETNTLYVNDGSGLFDDRTIETGLAPESLPYTSFGNGWLDVDNDGWLDLLVLNGAVKILEPLAAAEDPYPIHQPNQLFRNIEGRRFEDVSKIAGDAFTLSEVSRGAAFGDVDNDGDTDVLQINSNGPARLLMNQVGQRHGWVGARIASPEASATNARVVATPSGASPVWRRSRRAGSYCSSSDPRTLSGLAAAAGPIDLGVARADGVTQHWTAVPPGRYLSLPLPVGDLDRSSGDRSP